MRMQDYKDIDAYIADFPADRQEVLKKIRKVVKEAVPKGEESIRYGMPTMRLNGKNLVHFAAFKNHYGFYPTPSGIVEFKKELAPYEKSKGTIQFQVGEEIPYDLIKKVVEFRIGELEKGKKNY